MSKYLINAFSAGMLPAAGADVEFRPLDVEGAKDLLARWAMEGWASAVGHADVAAVFAVELGHKVALNRATLALSPGDDCLLGQYVGPRLPEGTKVLPAGAEIRWVRVRVLRAGYHEEVVRAAAVAAAGPAVGMSSGLGGSGSGFGFKGD